MPPSSDPLASLKLSPSECHARFLAQAPRLAYAGGPVRTWQRRLRAELWKTLGLDQMPAKRPPLAVKRLWQKKLELGTVTKIAFVAEPGCHALAYVCLPHDVRPPYRFIICLQGHSTGMHNSIGLDENEEHPIAVEGDRDFALACMRNGFAALALEQRSLGQRRESKQARRSFHNSCHDAAMRALMLGRTLLGERVYDVDRALDYLVSRGDVDTENIGVMGNSGGGTIATYAAGLLPRIGFVMPSCSVCTLRASLMTIHHCSDNYVPGLYLLADVPDILGLAAPKPAVIVAGKEDQIFPAAGTQKAFSAVRRIYQAARAADRVKLVMRAGGHRFYAAPAFGALRGLLSGKR